MEARAELLDERVGQPHHCDYAAFRVRAAFAAAALRALFPRFAAAILVCRERDDLLAELRGSRFNAASVARERVADGWRRGFLPAFSSCAAFFRRAGGPSGLPSFTPARRAFESPIAIACLAERAPCFPSRM
jgi:hypothetical protein